MKIVYELEIGPEKILVAPTGKREVLKDCSFSRRIYKVVDYMEYEATFLNDLVYLFPHQKLKKVKKNGNV